MMYSCIKLWKRKEWMCERLGRQLRKISLYQSLVSTPTWMGKHTLHSHVYHMHMCTHILQRKKRVCFKYLYYWEDYCSVK